MALRDLFHNVFATLSLSPAARVNGTATGTAIDLRGYDSAMIVASFGTYTDGTHTFSLQHSTDNVTYTAVSASELQGSFTAASSAAASNTTQMVGYAGSARYVRVVLTVTGATTGALSTAHVLAGEPKNAPVQ